ncbi:hypothetical protein GCM10010206_18550 [Streptomyces cinerochromogenes]|nr:hypothetical protein [Streptomyces cinerochromogenes]GGS57136.1 hypothetical protein GCM10010206_18550 [Streptomyces cinerochromogenes]
MQGPRVGSGAGAQVHAVREQGQQVGGGGRVGARGQLPARLGRDRRRGHPRTLPLPLPLPLPATYVIDRAGTVRWAFVDTDYTARAEPADVLAALDALNRAAGPGGFTVRSR